MPHCWSDNQDGYQVAGSICNIDMLDKGMIHIPTRTEWEGMIFPYATQNDVRLKNDELFISGIFHLIIFRPQLTMGNWNHGKQN